MMIPNFEVQTVLRAYGQQQALRLRVSKNRLTKPAGSKDERILSAESKKRYVAKKIAGKMVRQIVGGAESTSNTREILSRLAQEYGQPLKVEVLRGRKPVFMVLEKDKKEENQTEDFRVVTPEETDALKGKMFDIAQRLIYSDLQEEVEWKFRT